MGLLGDAWSTVTGAAGSAWDWLTGGDGDGPGQDLLKEFSDWISNNGSDAWGQCKEWWDWISKHDGKDLWEKIIKWLESGGGTADQTGPWGWCRGTMSWYENNEDYSEYIAIISGYKQQYNLPQLWPTASNIMRNYAVFADYQNRRIKVRNRLRGYFKEFEYISNWHSAEGIEWATVHLWDEIGQCQIKVFMKSEAILPWKMVANWNTREIHYKNCRHVQNIEEHNREDILNEEHLKSLLDNINLDFDGCKDCYKEKHRK